MRRFGSPREIAQTNAILLGLEVSLPPADDQPKAKKAKLKHEERKEVAPKDHAAPMETDELEYDVFDFDRQPPPTPPAPKPTKTKLIGLGRLKAGRPHK